MPKYIDHHAMPAMSPEQAKATIAQLKAGIESKKADAYGVTTYNIFMTPTEAWCYLEAPNAEAVLKHHEAMGIKVAPHEIKAVSPVV